MDPVQPTKAAIIVDQTGQSLPLGREVVTIGRKSGNTIVLGEDLKVSRHHATIRWETGTYIVQDVGSANGTFLNDERLTAPQPLNNGDVIRVGDTTLTVMLPPEDTEPSLKLMTPEAGEPAGTAPAPTGKAVKATDTEPDVVTNPYVGPRTFTQVEGDRFFGREREARELHSLIISERLVLYYAQSGAGKSSLLNTRVVPQLQEAGLAVLPIGRVGGELPEEVTGVENIFIFNLLLSLDESDGDPNRFTRMQLSEFLTRLTSQDGMHYYYDQAVEPGLDEESFEASPYVLIIDQFEEIITNHPGRWHEREGFFIQLAQAMTDDELLWVVLTLREDFVAALDPYIHILPDNLRARFYMQRMSHDAALEAIKKPAERFSRPFAPSVAENLVDNLRQIRVHGSASRSPDDTQVGQFVEPVQLQVACYQLWENLLKQNQPVGQITQQNLDELGDVDQALAQFYEEAILEVVVRTRVTEIYLRNWFEDELITEAGTKGMVYRGRTRTGGIPNEAVDVLVAKFILRSEVKSGGTWYELIHDRFIEPILQSNRQWREEQPLIRMAENWKNSDKPASLLLQREQLKEVMEATNWRALGRSVREFIEASQAAQEAREDAERAEREALQQHELEQARALAEERQRRARTIAIGGGVAVVLAFAAGLLGVGWFNSFLARVEAEVTVTAAVEIAETKVNDAATSEKRATIAQGTADAFRATSEALGGTATSNAATGEALSTEATSNAATAEALGTAAAANASEAQRILEQQDIFFAAVAEATAAKETEVAIAAATAQSRSGTATAIAALPPPFTATPTETATPVGPVTPPPASDITATPVPVATPTSDSDAEIQAQVAALNATQTAVAVVHATQTVVYSSRSSCLVEPKGEFAEVWNRYGARLGCPVQQPIGGQFAEQPFEKGYMIWSAITDPNLFFAIVGDDSGKWFVADQKEVDSYNPKDGVACDLGPPPSDGLSQPIRGFGALWCGRDDIRDQIGWGKTPEFAVIDNALQRFENGFVLRDSRSFIHVLFDDGSYVRVQS